MSTIPALASRNGEGSSRGPRMEATLADAMRAPSNAPDIRVLDRMPKGLDAKETLNYKEDLWLTTHDGRYSSPIIPVRVGIAPHREVFQVHKNVLLKSEWFRKALCGNFAEASAQSLDLPVEDPAIFHFLIAYLYEDRYAPTKPLSTVLIPDDDKGKGREDELNMTVDVDSDGSTVSTHSDESARSRFRDFDLLPPDRRPEYPRRKHPGVHRPECSCPQCIANGPCLSCGFPTRGIPPTQLPPPPPAAFPPQRSNRHTRRGLDGRPLPRTESPPPPATVERDLARIKGEDMRTWLITYELNMDVYLCADRFLLDDFKRKVARVTIDMLETAGSDAAQIEVLKLCAKLYDGVSDNDPLLKMVFARVGFLQSKLWRKAPVETNRFLTENPEVGALILKEMAIRGEADLRSGIPSMERNSTPPPVSPMIGMHPQYRPRHAGHRIYY